MSGTASRLWQRLRVRSANGPATETEFASDVRAGLRAVPKTLPPKYFYDELGSALFEAICKLPEYYLTRMETEILRAHGGAIVLQFGGPLDLLELGSGSAVKTRLLIEETLKRQSDLRYHPIDISAEALRAAANALAAAYPQLEVVAHAGDYFAVLGSPELVFERRVLALFLGSNIGNYDSAGAQQLLSRLAAALRPGDGLLLGADLKKEAPVLVAAYDDPTGVTAAFNKNLLARINRELGGKFELENFRHRARYDAEHGRVDSFLEAREAAAYEICALDMTVRFARGEQIHTESSYKFSHAQLERMAATSGFSLLQSWSDARNWYSVNLLVKS